LREAAEALRSLGYKPAEVSRMVREAAEPEMSAEDIIRKALQRVAA
jgi:Holliday junction DNA helicase RuvA